VWHVHARARVYDEPLLHLPQVALPAPPQASGRALVLRGVLGTGDGPMSHCLWCSDQWRSTLLSLAFKAPAREIARHYGMTHSTVASVFTRARKRGCLASRKCQHCGADVNPRRDVCASRACYNMHAKLYQRSRRSGHIRVAPSVPWPVLPPNPRPAPRVPASRRRHAARRRYVLAPPLCPTIGSLVHGRMAA
jgi:hypothetical protein